jgi:hypothetical protein
MTQLSYCTDVVIDNMKRNEHGCIPMKVIYKETVAWIWPMGHSLPTLESNRDIILQDLPRGELHNSSTGERHIKYRVIESLCGYFKWAFMARWVGRASSLGPSIVCSTLTLTEQTFLTFWLSSALCELSLNFNQGHYERCVSQSHLHKTCFC